VIRFLVLCRLVINQLLCRWQCINNVLRIDHAIPLASPACFLPTGKGMALRKSLEIAITYRKSKRGGGCYGACEQQIRSQSWYLEKSMSARGKNKVMPYENTGDDCALT